MRDVRKGDLQKIWNWLEDETTAEELEFMVKLRKAGLYQVDKANNKKSLSLRIQEALATKSKEKGDWILAADGTLLKWHWCKLAELLGIQVGEETPKKEIISLVLQKIEDENR